MKFTFDGNDYDIKFAHTFLPSLGSGKNVAQILIYDILTLNILIYLDSNQFSKNFNPSVL